MKKFFTLKSVFTLIAAFALAMPAWASVNSVSDLFGKYKFTAEMEITPADESFSDKFTNKCEVTIGKNESEYMAGAITGIAGLSGTITINTIDMTANTISILSPNTGLGAEGLYLSDITGSKNIFTGDHTQYGDLVYTFDPETKTITIPDFTLVTKNSEQKVDFIVAKFTNVTLTFIGGEEESAVTDLSGDWHFVAGDGEYDTMNGSTLPTKWDMTLTATDEFNKTYDVNFVLGDFAPLALTATFDGEKLVVAFDNAYLDVENMISLGDYNSAAAASEFEFELKSKNELSLTYGMRIVGEVPSLSILQYYGAGVATRSVAEEEAFDWVGTYTVTVGEIVVKNDAYTYPKTFEMEILYDDTYGPEYVIKKFFGQDVTFGYNQYGWGLSAYPTDASDQIDLDLSLANGLVDLGGDTYLGLFDLEDNASKIAFKEENGVVTIDNFQVMYYAYGGTPTLVATYKNVTAVKKSATDGIENTVVENNTVEGIFDLLGRKLDAITVPGLYIVNGKKVIVK